MIVSKRAKISGDVKDLKRVKAGFWAEARGRWMKRGTFEASKIEISRDAPGASFADGIASASLQESKKLDGSEKIYNDAQVTDYVRKVAEPLVTDYARSLFDFSFGVIRDPSLNAFALPNGAVYVHTGLLARLDNEAQLAVVLGHEISHVTQRHGQRQYRTSMTTFIPAQIGAMVLGVEVQNRTDNPLLQAMVGLGINLGLSAAVSGYGRKLEDQSDRVGLRYTVDAGYDPREGPKVWDIFNDIYGDESKIENFFYGNHSTNDIRKKNLRTEIARHYSEEKGRVAPASRPSDEKGYQTTMLNVTRDNAVDDFNVKRYRLATKGFQRVLEYRPDDAVAHHYNGRIILATDQSAGAPERALQEYLKAVSSESGYGDVHRDLGLLYQQTKRPVDAKKHLLLYLDLAPKDAKDRKEVEKILAGIK